VDNSTIVASLVTQEEGRPTVSHRDGSDANLPLRLRAIFLDAAVGKIKSVQAWPSDSRFAGIVAANEGKVVAQTGTTLTLYSSDAKELKKLILPPLQEGIRGWFAYPSPTGRSILFASPNLTTTGETLWIWVDTATLEARSWKEMQTGSLGISDNAIAMTACVIGFYHCDANVEIRGLVAGWKRIASIERKQSYPRFLNEDILFLSGHPWKLLRTDGEVMFTEDAPFEGSVASMAIPSAGGQRFVVPFFKLTGGVSALDIGAHGELKTISVYDAPFHERSYRLKMIGPKIKDQGTELALSPDGSLLAILHDESVYLLQLPPPLPTP
jgi:hypothetical protein